MDPAGPAQGATPERAQRKAERLRATVMFAELSGFTSLAERLGTERAYAHVSACMRLMDGVLRRYGGSVDKYLGDAVLAVFGYPVPRQDAARQAVLAALEMRARVGDYVRESGLDVALGLSIGINTGSMIAGDIRGRVIREFHVLGDAVNTAARIKSKAPAGAILVGEETRREAGEGAFRFRALPPMELKGKEKPVSVHVVESLRQAGASSRESLVDAALAGRGSEIARLREAAAGLAAGRGGCLALVGPGGIGKTRLLVELRRSAECSSLAVFEAVASPLTAGDAAALFAGIGDLETAGRPPAAETLLAAMRGACAGRPMLLVVEDLQWAGEEATGILGRLVGLARAGELLVLASCNPEEPGGARALERLEQALGRLPRVELGPLAAPDALRLVSSLTRAEQPSDEVLELMVARGGGNPRRLVMASFHAGALRSETERERAEERGGETERRRSTVLFADITGFTAMSERMDAADAYPIVADCLALLDAIARKHGGTVDKYLGDCVLALFGVPRAMEDAPRAALNAAIEMVEEVRRFSCERGLVHPLDVHVGVNTGLGIAGEISGPLIREFAMMGDPVLIASALTDRAGSGRIFVGAETRRFTRDEFDYREVGSLKLPGRTGAVPAYELLSRRQRLHRARVGGERQVFSPLVGRERELAAFEEALEALRGARGGIVSVVAEAGVGKSRLVAEVARRAAETGVAWLEGRAISTGQQLSYHPFADLCRQWAGIDDDDDLAAARGKLEALVERAAGEDAADVLLHVAAIVGVPLRDAERLRLERIQAATRDRHDRLVHAALTKLLRPASAEERAVVVLDDLHWADQSSLEGLASMLRLVVEAPILFVLVFRPGYVETSEPVLQRARSEYAAHHVELALAPLPASAARELIKNLFRGGDVPHRTRRAIEEKSRGNPFYIEEVVRSLHDQGALEWVDGAFRATARIDDVEIPGSVQEVVMARVDRLPLRRKRLLQIASVVGQGFHHDVLEALAPEPGALDAELEALERADFLVPWDRLQGEEYAFKHPLIQEVTYDGIVESRRRELHCAVAEAIEGKLPKEMPGRDGMLAFHFSMAREAERAERYLFRAGDEAAAVGASSEALQFFRQASELYFQLHGDGGDAGKKALLEKNVALALYNRGQLIEADEHFGHALRWLGERVPSGRGALAVRLARDVSSVLTSLYLRPAKRRPAASDVDRVVIDLMMKRAEAQTTTSPTRFLLDSLQTLARLERVDAATVPGSGGMYAGTVGIFSYGGLAFGLSRRFLGRARELVRSDDPDEQMFFRFMSFLHHLLEGDWSDAHEVEDALLEEALGAGRLWPVTNYLNLHALKCVYRGDYGRARARIAWLRRISDGYEHDLAASAAEALEGILHLERRELPQALRALDHYYDEHAEAPFRVSALGNRAEALLQAGDLAAASQSLERARGYVEEAGRVLPYHLSSYLRARYHREVAALERGDRGRAREARRARGAALAVAGKVAWRRPETLRLAARHAFALGSEADARRWWERALAACEALGARADHARARVEIGERLAPSRPVAGLPAEEHLAAGRRGLAELGLSAEPAPGRDAA